MQIEAWYKLGPSDDLKSMRQWVESILQRHGFKVLPWTGSSSEDEEVMGDWKRVSLDGNPVYFGLSPRTQGHGVLSLRCRAPRKELAPAFLSLFSELVTRSDRAVKECILPTTNMDDYPFFTSVLSSPIQLVKLNEDNSVQAQLGAGDAEYWAEVGPKLHFVATHLFKNTGMPTPQAWSTRIRAPIIGSPLGPIFDCGWSSLFPLLPPTF